MVLGARIATAACVAGAMTAVSCQSTFAEAKKPVGTTPARPVAGITKLSVDECKRAEGILYSEFACISGVGCETTDEKGKKHQVCISQQ
jgi:hypothetical protein